MTMTMYANKLLQNRSLKTVQKSSVTESVVDLQLYTDILTDILYFLQLPFMS